MLAMPKILSFKPARVMVLDRLIIRIIKESSRSDGVISFFSCIRTAMFELLLFMCFGFDLSEDSLLQIVEIVDAILHLPSRAMQDFYPFTSIFFRGQERRVSELRARQIKVYTSLIEEHKERCAHGTISPGSYLETLLHLDTGMPFSTVDLVTLCSEFIVAGTDTTVTTLEWAMARLADDASIQGKLLDEIKAVVGDRPVEETDLQKLPYLQAIVRETLRLHPPGHFLLPHAVSEACKIGGYDIPANAVVLFHVIAMGRDPQHWEKPLEFKPDRFLNKEFDVTGTKQSTMLPFGAGRRICPGLGLATMHLELFIARLVQKLNWTPYLKGERVDFDEKMVFTVRMKNPLKVLVEQRNT
ncbi:hypothetical protein KP509_29G073600 [Ceratopteris richardii]|nr:hypothetical protein KP509_29G073600 [Ceratopteris richardii]